MFRSGEGVRAPNCAHAGESRLCLAQGACARRWQRENRNTIALTIAAKLRTGQGPPASVSTCSIPWHMTGQWEACSSAIR